VIYLDSNVIIRFIEADPATTGAPIADRLKNAPALLASQLSRLECRCRPLRQNDQQLLSLYDGFFTGRELSLIDLNAAGIDRATELRAPFNFRRPDALHLACALEGGASIFPTGDHQLSRCMDIAVEIL
jgi:predicted nucleic acid-binding protein